jgi:hypothetical protein
MTISVYDNAWRNDVVPFAKDGVDWTSIQKVFVFTNGAWVQYYGPGTGSCTMGLFTGSCMWSTSLGSFICDWATFTSVNKPSAYLLIDVGCCSAAAGVIYAIIAGGSTGGTMTGDAVVTAEKCIWSTLVTSLSVSSDLTIARYLMAAVSSSVGGLFSGGRAGAAAYLVYSTSDLCNWATAVTGAQASAELSSARTGISSAYNLATGLFMGGSLYAGTYQWNDPVVTADLCTLATFSTAVQSSAALTSARAAASGTSNYTEFSLFVGGGTSSTPTVLADVCLWETLVTSARPSANCPVALNGISGSGSVDTAMFIGGILTYGMPPAMAWTCPWSTMTMAYAEFAALSISLGAVCANGAK